MRDGSGNELMAREEITARFGLPVDPCPFCFSFHRVGLRLGPHMYVTCTACEAEGPHEHGPSPDPIAAVSRWNSRNAPVQPEYRPERRR